MITYLTMIPDVFYVRTSADIMPAEKLPSGRRVFVKDSAGLLWMTKEPCKYSSNLDGAELMRITMIDTEQTYEVCDLPKKLAVEKILCYSTASGALNWRRESSPPTPEEGLKRLKKFDFNTSELE